MATLEKRVGRSGQLTWRAKIRRAGERQISKSFTKKTEAEAWARSIEGRIDTGEQLPTAESRKRTVAHAIERFLLEVYPRSARRKNASEQTRILIWWRQNMGSRFLNSLTPSVIADVRSKLSAKKSKFGTLITGATINRYMAALSCVMRVTVKEFGWLTKNPVTNVSRFAEGKGRERYLSPAERSELLSACSKSKLPALLPLVQLALATGARRGELVALQWSGVDLDRRTLRFIDTKNGESRTVPLAFTAVETLSNWRGSRDSTGPVFPSVKGKLESAWQVAREVAGIRDFHFHDLRHSAASYLAMSGASLMDIAAILGHKTLAMVKRYSHLSEQHTTAAIDRMAEKFLKDSS